MRSVDLAAAGLRHHRRSHLSVALGVAVATAVLTGALLVGDSVRGSLRGLTLKRLGKIDHALVTGQPFRAALADELQANPGFKNNFLHTDAAWLLRGSLSFRGDAGRRYASGVSVVGCGAAFSQHGAPWADALRAGVVLTAPLADELSVDEGDEILLRLPSVSDQPADSTLGDKADATVSRRLKVAKVIDAEAPLACFSLAPSQRPPRNLFIRIGVVQDLLEQPDTANAILAGGSKSDASPNDWLRPTLEDYGLSVEPLAIGDVQIESNQLVLPETVVTAARAAFGDSPQPVVTYLANTIKLGGKSIPYSTVTGVDSNADGPLLDGAGKPVALADDEVVLNNWAAERLEVKPGDKITITYYEPESTHGKLVEAAPITLTLKAVVPIEGPAGDPRLTPVLEGVTDADSIGDWDLPFELTEPISRADEDYWDDYSTTPKAFVSLALAKRLWATRWGSISLLRVPGAGAETVSQQLREAIDPTDIGFVFQPVKRLGLEASAGSTPFDGLFFGFSLFLIAAAVLLVVLLFGLGVEQRAREVGLLAAIGWDQPTTRRVLMREGLMVAALGAVCGVPLGVLYAWLMIQGLATLWVAAIVSPFLELHITLNSLVIGGGLGLLFAWLAIRQTLRRVVAQPAKSLLAGQATGAASTSSRAAAWTGWLATGTIAAAVALGVAATRLQGEAQAGAFFGSGTLLLIALLTGVRGCLARSSVAVATPCRFGNWSLALRNIARAPSRSLLTIALVASASFLILAISAFRLDPTEQGTGGFVLVAHSDQPIHFDLNTDEGRDEFPFTDADIDLLDQFTIHALRVHDGEDASCLNLYQTRQPRVLGLPEQSDLLSRFTFADKQPTTGSRQPTAPITTTLDFNTAMYSLKLYGGVGSRLTIRDGVDREVDVEVSGLLKNSLLQGDLIVAESDFLKLYPATGGYRFFLIEPRPNNDPRSPSRRATLAGKPEPRLSGERGSPAIEDAAEEATDDAAALAAMLEDRLSDYGFDTEDAEQRLAGFLAVQNTYLSTFQSLGALGLLLGAVGVAVVQMRNLAERRGELALMRAAGFDNRSLRSLIFRENLALLAGGLAVGTIAALVALVPQSFAQQTRPPWLDAVLLMAVIGVIGLVVGSIATRRATRVPIVAALRGE